MPEFQPAGMEELAGQREIAVLASIDCVSDHWMVNGGKVNPNLVGATSSWFDVYQRVRTRSWPDKVLKVLDDMVFS